jgi:VIT1/CCC1 family predicted Fe2+/Mn2+ transporter
MRNTDMAPQNPAEAREPVLDVVDRISEMCFGLFMALTFVGAVSTAPAGQDPGHTMLRAALGCNLAWGLVDAVMFLVRTLASRGKRLRLAQAVKHASDAAAGVAAIRDALPKVMKSLVTNVELEAIRARLAAAPALPTRPWLNAGDLLDAVGIFCIVVLSTFPVALPFVLLADIPTALLISRLLTLAMLFGGGVAIGYHAGLGPWRAGFATMALGVALTMAIVALGG